MKVQLDKTFPMPSSPAIAWQFLQDVEAVAGCMPGAKLTEKVDEIHHKGTVTVRLGPATMSFRGEVAVQDIDAATQSRGGELAGVISIGDVVKNQLAEIERERQALRDYISTG